MKLKSGLSWLWLSIATCAFDLFIKYVVVQRFELYESINVLPIFNLTYVRNYGAAFSFLADHSGWQRYLFIILAVVISGAMIYFLAKNSASKRMENIGYALVIGGAWANGIDRAYNGYVVDYLDFFWQNWHYPTFNIADIWIVSGACLLVLESFLSDKKSKKE